MEDLIIKVFENILQPFLWLLLAVAFIVFLWGIAEFIKNADSADGRKTGGKHILWGVVGLAIMISALGITRIIANTLGIQDGPGAGDTPQGELFPSNE